MLISKARHLRKVFAIMLAISLVLVSSIVPFGTNKVYAAVQATYYVAVNGSDSNPGTLAQPFATIQKARDVVRTINGNMTGDIYVYIRGGKYFQNSAVAFNESDSGTNGNRVYYKNYSGEEPIIVGGQAVTGWTLYSGNIYCANVGTSWKFYTLYENGVRAMMARTPNLVGYPRESYSRVESSVTGYLKTKFVYKAGDLPSISSYADAQVNMWSGYDWFSETIPISSVDTNTRTITLANSTLWNMSANNRYYIQGAIELLDKAGEFYLNRTTGYLYYWPMSTPIANQEIIAPTTKRIIEVKGSTTSNIVQNISFEGLTVTMSDFNDAVSREDSPNFDKDSIRHANVLLENAKNINVKFCKIQNAGYSGILLSYYAQNNTIYGNMIENVGYNGVGLLGYDLGATAPDYNINNIVSNNYINHCGVLIGNGAGVHIFQSGGNEISYNEIRNVTRYGISIKGHVRSYDGSFQIEQTRGFTDANHFNYLFARNNNVKFNDVYLVNQDSTDTGLIELWTPGKNNVIDNNRLHDSSGNGVYLDDNVCYTTVKNNIIYNNVDGFGSIVAKGRWNTVTNNIIANNNNNSADGVAFPLVDNLDSSDQSFTKNIVYNSGNMLYSFNYNSVLSNDYPYNLNFVSDYGTYYNSSGIYRVANIPGDETYVYWRTILNNKYEQNSSARDPLFVDPSNSDYNLQSSSPAYSLGFVQIDQSSIGLKSDYPFTRPTKKDAYATIQAESCNKMYGTTNYGTTLGDCDNNDWVLYEDVDLKNGAYSFQANLAVPAEYAGQKIEVRLDSASGTKVGELTTVSTGSWSTFVTQSTTITGAKGIHDVYLVFKGSWGVCSLDWVKFVRIAKDAYSIIQAESYDSMSGIVNYGTTIGSCDLNDWVCYKGVDFGINGAYKFEANLAVPADYAGQQIEVRLDSTSGTLAGTLTTQSTGSWTTFVTQSTGITGASGVHDVYLVFKGSIGTGVCSLDWVRFIPNKDAYSTIEAEKYESMSGISNDGNTIGSLDPINNDWVCYKGVEFGVNGAYKFQANLAVPANYEGQQIEVRLDSATGTLIGTLTTQSTGSWTTFVIQSANVTGASGKHDVYLVFKGSIGWGVCALDWINFITLRNPYSTVEAESYNGKNGIDNQGTAIGGLDLNDWVFYKGMNFGSGAATFQVSLAVPAAYAGQQIEVRLDGTSGTLVGTLTTQSTGSWSTYTTQSITVSGVTGVHDLYLISKGNGVGGIDWIKFIQ